jgi:hypothetical protein
MHQDDTDPMMIPAGSIVEIAPTRSKVGIVTALYESRMFWVFLHDLLEAEKVESDGNVG